MKKKMVQLNILTQEKNKTIGRIGGIFYG